VRIFHVARPIGAQGALVLGQPSFGMDGGAGGDGTVHPGSPFFLLFLLILGLFCFSDKQSRSG
jgi:hypothetical protein